MMDNSAVSARQKSDLSNAKHVVAFLPEMILQLNQFKLEDRAKYVTSKWMLKAGFKVTLLVV